MTSEIRSDKLQLTSEVYAITAKIRVTPELREVKVASDSFSNYLNA